MSKALIKMTGCDNVVGTTTRLRAGRSGVRILIGVRYFSYSRKRPAPGREVNHSCDFVAWTEKMLHLLKFKFAFVWNILVHYSGGKSIRILPDSRWTVGLPVIRSVTGPKSGLSWHWNCPCKHFSKFSLSWPAHLHHKCLHWPLWSLTVPCYY
jgi:hypothetical protein